MLAPFAHADSTHLANNLTTGIAIGAWVEALHGHARFTLLYFVTGLGGTLSYRAAWCADGALRPVAYVGASPAVYGFMGASAASSSTGRRCASARCGSSSCFRCSRPISSCTCTRRAPTWRARTRGAAWGLLLGPLVLRNAVVRAHERVAASLAAVGLVFLILASLPCD